MKYTTTVVINKTLKEVYSALDDREAAFKWIDGLVAFDLVEGKLGEVHSKYQMKFQNQKGKFSSMTEQITRKTSSSITTLYETKGVWNECINQLIEDKDITTYNMHTTFKFGTVTSLFMWLFKSVFKKETMKSLTQFKNYCESIE
jgi:hypothetical protein